MELQVGARLPERTIESVSPEHMKSLAVVLDDPNPIHLDPAAAAALGLGDRVVNQGPANFGYVIDMLRAALPGAELRELSIRLTSNVFGGDRVVAGGTVESVEPGEGGALATCAVWLDVDGGKRALDATAKLLVPGAA